MKVNAIIISPATPQITDMAMISPFDSGLRGVVG